MALDGSAEFAGGTVITSSGEALRLVKRIDGGGEGTVFHVKGKPTVVKIFHEGKRSSRERKIRSMIKNPPKDPGDDHQTFVWPQAAAGLPQHRCFIGYEMPYVNLRRFHDSVEYACSLRWEDTAWSKRCKAALNLSWAVCLTHRQGHALGDMNEKNILFSDGKVTLIDCDGFGVQGSTTYYPGEVLDPRRHAPPEGRGNTRRAVQYADRFGLAVHVFQLLMQGFHPFHSHGRDATPGSFREKLRNDPFPFHQPSSEFGPPPHAPEYSRLPASVRAGFEQCFVEGKHSPRKRPAPEMWVRALADLHPPRNATRQRKRPRRRKHDRHPPSESSGNPVRNQERLKTSASATERSSSLKYGLLLSSITVLGFVGLASLHFSFPLIGVVFLLLLSLVLLVLPLGTILFY